jgi:hypothetical protein
MLDGRVWRLNLALRQDADVQLTFTTR